MTDRIEKTIDIDAPVDRVWRAITDHEAFGQWFGVKLEQPFTAGGDSSGHITYPGYEHIRWHAKVVAVERPRLFSFTWHPYAIDPNVDYSGETPTLVEFRLEPKGQGTHLTVVETGFDKIPPHRQPDALRMNDSGWAQQVVNVKRHVEG
ncbi:MAG TPA: SRPBCC family protein [Caulobacteraceae bacterium]|jgi:uncharacterized protein YndB with AHSA1/START domain